MLWRAAWLVVGGGALLACSGEVSRAPLAQNTCSVNCGGPGRGTLGGSPGTAGSGAMDGPDAAAPPAAGVVRGQVFVFQDQTLATTDQLTGVTVDVQGTDLQGDVTTSRTDNTARFALEDVATSAETWLGVRPLDTTSGLLTTLQPFDLTQNADIVANVLPTRLLEEIAGSGLSRPVTLDEDLGHVFLSFVDGDDAPVSGLSIVRSEAELVAYDAGLSYSDQLAETQFRGVALLLNIEGAAFPGRDTVITVSDGARDIAVRVPIVRGAVSIATVVP